MSTPTPDLSLPEAAFVLGVAHNALYRGAVAGDFPTVRRKVGASVRLFVRRDDLPAAAAALGVACPTPNEIAEALKVEA